MTTATIVEGTDVTGVLSVTAGMQLTDGMLSYAALILADKPIAYYRLDERSGTIAHDSSGNGYNGTLVGGVTLGVPGLIAGSDTAMSFDGSTGYINASAPLSAASDVSIETWVNLQTLADDSSGVARRLVMLNIDGTNAWQLTCWGGNGFIFAANDSSGQILLASTDSGSGYQPLITYHLVGTWFAATRMATLYVDGISVNDASTSGWGIGSVGFNIGRRTDSTGYAEGTIDEPAIYNYALSPAQVAAHYQAGYPARAQLLSLTDRTVLALDAMSQMTDSVQPSTQCQLSSTNAPTNATAGNESVSNALGVALTETMQPFSQLALSLALLMALSEQTGEVNRLISFLLQYSLITLWGARGIITFTDYGGSMSSTTDDYTPRYVGDTSRPLQATFTDGLGGAYNLTGASGMTLKLRNRSSGVVIVGSGTWQITNATNGEATYTWSANDVAATGLFDVQVSADMPDGEKHWNSKPLEILPIW